MKCPHNECKEVCNSPLCKWHCEAPSTGADPAQFAQIGGEIAEKVMKDIQGQIEGQNAEKIALLATEKGRRFGTQLAIGLGPVKLQLGAFLGGTIGKVIGEQIGGNEERKIIDSATGKKLGEDVATKMAARMGEMFGKGDKNELGEKIGARCLHPECQLKCGSNACMVPGGYKDIEPLEAGWKIIKTFQAPAAATALDPHLKNKPQAADIFPSLLELSSSAEGNIDRGSQTVAVEVSMVAQILGSSKLELVHDRTIHLPIRRSRR